MKTRKQKNSYSKKIALGLLSAGISSIALGQSTQNPNIVLIFTDDQGYGDLGCYGSEKILTPTIDSLAQNGVRFTNFYVSQAVSSASRASLLTGCYSNRIGITGALTPDSDIGISSNELTIAEMLKELGYATGIFGKWHLGDQEKFLPLQHGFDEYVGWPYSNDMWPVSYDNKPLSPENSAKGKYPVLQLIEDNTKTTEFHKIEQQDTITSLLTQKAVDFIHRKSDQPFFLYLPHPMPHVPLAVSEKFAGKSEYGKYGDVIMEVDWSVKQIIKALNEEGITDNTLIIFTSDNGPWKNMGDHGGTTAGLREGKGTSWEGGHKVPCVMSWPGHIPEGTTIKNMASTIDILPTIAEITGGKLPDHTIDGVSILEMMHGDTLSEPRKTFCYYYNDNELQAVQKNRWKLVFPHFSRSYEGVEPGKNGMPGKYNFFQSGLELYNLNEDPFEKNDLAEQFPEKVKELNQLADSFRNDMGDFLTGTEGTGLRESGYKTEMNTKIEHLAIGANVKLHNDYNKRYTGRGSQGLTDGILGRPSYKDKSWQGYHGSDADIEIQFNEKTPLNKIIVSTMKNEDAWIFLPTEITILYSEDGETFKELQKLQQEDFISDSLPNKYMAVSSQKCEAISIRIKAKNTGECPEGHVGAGHPAWLFIDEIIVK